MKKRIVGRAIGIFLCISMGACSAVGEDNKKPEKVAKRPPIAIEAAKIRATELTEGIDVVGSLVPKFETDVKSEYTGIVTEVYVTEWVHVTKGTPLAKLDTREMDLVLRKAQTAVEIAKANLLQAEVVSNRANREYERLLRLKEAGLVTQQNLDDGLTDKEAAAARIATAQAQIKAAEDDVLHTETRLSKALICSPVDGVVAVRNVNVGDFVGEMGAKPMFRIVDSRILDITVTVPSSEMEAVKVGQILTFSTDALPGKNFTGTIQYINPIVSEADRSVKITAEVQNISGQLKGGVFIKGRIITKKRVGVLKVPRIAFINWDVIGKKGELFLLKGDLAHRRRVETGKILADDVEVISGLSAGDLVITRGGFNVKDGDQVTIIKINGDHS